MRHRRSVWLWLLVFGAVCLAQQKAPGEQFVGVWTGTWDGAGTGGFELTLDKDATGAIGGKVSVTGEPSYSATLTTVAFDGNKMNAKYDFTPQAGGEVVLTATFDGKTATGTWSLREKASGSELASGPWTVSRK